MAGTSNFAARTRDHTFASGRVVRVREHLSYTALMSRMQRDDEDGLGEMFAAFMSGEQIPGEQMSAALRLNDVLIQEYVVRPKVLIGGVDLPGDDDTYGDAWCWISDLTDDEMAEIIDLASAGVSQAHRFPGDAAIDDDREDGEVLGDDAKPDARPRKRKR